MSSGGSNIDCFNWESGEGKGVKWPLGIRGKKKAFSLEEAGALSSRKVVGG